jgi:N-acetylglutamate synthase-like GNAT family acetyltransferase
MQDAVHVRLARASERLALEALQARASLANPSDREAILANPDAIDLPQAQIDDCQVYVAEIAGSIQGFAALLPREDGNAELDALFVDPGTWRQGIGRKLIDRCVAVARLQGAAAIHVVGNPHAEGFYRACGFELVGTTTTRFGVGHLMRRLL